MNIDLNEIIKTALGIGAVVTINQDYVTIVPDSAPKPVPEEPKPEPKVEPHIIVKKAPNPKKQGAKKALDMGKVKALRDAGWTFDKIADEMGCSPQTIANRLKGEE